MAQVPHQQSQQGVWMVAGPPPSAAVQLAQALTVTYSDGSSDTLAAHVPAVTTTGATQVDRTTSVWVPYVLKGDPVLRLIKEQDLATLGGDAAPLARVLADRVVPYQPMPLYGSVAGSATLLSVAGQGKALDLGAFGTAPAGWPLAAFDDSAWAATLGADGTMAPLAGYTGTADFCSWNATSGAAPDDIWLFRQTVVLPAGTITAAKMQVGADNYVLDLYLNGTRVYGPGTGTNLWYTGGGVGPQSVTLSPAALPAGGGSLLIAARVQNEHAGGLAQATAFAYTLQVTYAGAGQLLALASGSPAQGDLAVYQGGAWQRLAVGTSGLSLGSNGTDPLYVDAVTAGPTRFEPVCDTSGSCLVDALGAPVMALAPNT